MTATAPLRSIRLDEEPRLSPQSSSLSPDPARWAIEACGVRKRFVTRTGMPLDWGMGSGHWIISTLVKYRKEKRWHEAVDGVDLQVARGELFGLLGPNGAGKTTLLKCLATLLALDGGEAFVNGYSVRGEPDRVRLSLNLVGTGQWTAFDWGMTVTQNLHFFGALYGLSRSERQARIDETLARLGLAQLAKETPRTLSSGERQRMLLAKGFMIRTPVFCLDEPTVGLDPDGARGVRDFIRQELIGRSGTSGILTTHRMPEAEALCGRIAIMHRGRIVACGTSDELKRLTGERSVLEIRAGTVSRPALAAVRALRGVRAAVAAPAGGEALEDVLRVHCEDAAAAGGPVVDTLRAQGIEVNGVETTEPTLEDAFIALTEQGLE
jgi:ABC-2 type transport system ATP-binding protein